MGRPVILLELNEVPFRIIDQYCRWEPDSSLSRLIGRCRQYVTVTEDVANLTPWITWASVHRGVNDERHLIHDLGQDLREVNQAYPPLWELAAGAGLRPGVCGSLHTWPLPADIERYAFYIPDAFAAGAECFPEHVAKFQHLNLLMSRASARNVSKAVPWRDALRVLASAPDLGLRPGTLVGAAMQLAEERTQPWKRVRRRTTQVELAFDIFMQQLRRTLPEFATFFTNHVASSMHRYWAAAFPEDYESFEYTQEWVQTYAREIRYTMDVADAFFARLVRFVDANPTYSLWIASSMGQHAVPSRPVETQLYVTDPERLFRAMGLGTSDWERVPAMLPRINFRVASGKAETVAAWLAKFEVEGNALTVRRKPEGFFSLQFGHENLYDGPQMARVGERAIPFAELGLENVEIEDKSNSSAYHIPEGALLIYEPEAAAPRQASRVQVSSLDLAPALLETLGIPKPAYMRRATGLATAP